MDGKIIFEAAQQAADGLATAQLWSTIAIGIVAVGVPAYFAWHDRTAKRAEARLRARSFALAHMRELEDLLDQLKFHTFVNPKGKPIVSHLHMQQATTALQTARIPIANLYLLDTAAAPIQRAFALASSAISYESRRAKLALQGENIPALDTQQGVWLHQAQDSLEQGLAEIQKLLQ
jgi:hypothetical protein